MQVDPIKPTLKAPGIHRLKLNYVKLLSNFAFKFNLRRYNLVSDGLPDNCMAIHKAVTAAKVGQCRLTLSNPS